VLVFREGRFALAEGGTIFLDEIGELPLDLQVKMLRVLEEGEFEPVGSSKPARVDVGVIAATNRDLHAMTRERTFHEDLYYRDNVFPIRLPSLRERGDDVAILAQSFAERLAKKMGRTLAPLAAEDSRACAATPSGPANVTVSNPLGTDAQPAGFVYTPAVIASPTVVPRGALLLRNYGAAGGGFQSDFLLDRAGLHPIPPLRDDPDRPELPHLRRCWGLSAGDSARDGGSEDDVDPDTRRPEPRRRPVLLPERSVRRGEPADRAHQPCDQHRHSVADRHEVCT
jgi:hypothetical protein